MSARCINCQLSRLKLHDLIEQYEQLIKTKDQEIICSHRIIAELDRKLLETKKNLMNTGEFAKEVEKNSHKILTEQQQIIQYLKKREVQLVEQLKNTEKEVFRLVIDSQDLQDTARETEKAGEFKNFKTPQKKVIPVTNSGNITLNKQNNTIDKIFQQSTIRIYNSENKDSLRLKVTEDKLQLMNIKYKMALLKTIEISTLQ